MSNGTLAPADGLYEFSGSSQPDVSFELKANSVRTASRGSRSIKFHDGGEIGVEYPIYYLRGEGPAVHIVGHNASREARLRWCSSLDTECTETIA